MFSLDNFQVVLAGTNLISGLATSKLANSVVKKWSFLGLLEIFKDKCIDNKHVLLEFKGWNKVKQRFMR